LEDPTTIRGDKLLLALHFLDDLYCAGAECSLEYFPEMVQNALTFREFDDPYGPWHWLGNIAIGSKRKELERMPEAERRATRYSIESLTDELVAETDNPSWHRGLAGIDQRTIKFALMLLFGGLTRGLITARDLDPNGRITEAE
jgi:hypothetical protein